MNDKEQIIQEAMGECHRLGTHITKRIDSLLNCNTYSYFTIEERASVLLDLCIDKLSSGHPDHNDELDLVCYMMIVRACRRIKMSNRWKDGVTEAMESNKESDEHGSSKTQAKA